MTSWHSPQSIFHVGHKNVLGIFDGLVNVEEKVDGSFFAFGLYEDSEGHRELRVRSKGATLYIDAPEKMFAKACEEVKQREHLLIPGWQYRGEYLQKPKHNTLAYDRTPQGNIIIFDICTGEEAYLAPQERAEEAQRIGFEVIPLLARGEKISEVARIRDFLDTTSVLGGQKIEGVVIKPVDYGIFGPDKKVLFAKFVSEAFKEIHGGEWKKNNPSKGDLVQDIIMSLRTPARWNKAIQHLREAGQLEDSPRDIGKLLKEIQQDLDKEAEEEIKERLFKQVWPHIKRGATGGFAEYYKQQLLEKAFEPEQPSV